MFLPPELELNSGAGLKEYSRWPTYRQLYIHVADAEWWWWWWRRSEGVFMLAHLPTAVYPRC